MKVLGVAVCAVLLMLVPEGLSASVGSFSPDSEEAVMTEDPFDASRVPVLESFVTPTLKPGDSGHLNFTLRNRYDSRIVAITLTLEIYSYATTTSTSPVTNGTVGHPALCLRPGQCSLAVPVGHAGLAGRNESLGSRLDVDVDVQTSAETAHGGVFDPATYLVRMVVDYAYEQVSTNATLLIPLRLLSRGQISDAHWDEARRGGGLNFTYLDSVYGTPQRALAGIATETSFIVREPVPQWPVFLLAGVMIACVAISMILYVRRDRRSAGNSDKTLEKRPREARE